jgi:hypothetical protein
MGKSFYLPPPIPLHKEESTEDEDDQLMINNVKIRNQNTDKKSQMNQGSPILQALSPMKDDTI